ncbi:MAG: AAA family ATPase [Pyrobaculum sp.]
MDLKDVNECVELKKFWVKNFKSLRDVTLEFPTRLTIVVGTNGSGKTALTEAFELLTSTVEWAMGRTTNPFLKWWGYDKVVWKHDENLPIILGLELEYKNTKECTEKSCDTILKLEYKDRKPSLSVVINICKTPIKIFYEIYITGKGGRFQILKERLRAQGNGLDISIDTDKGELTAAISKEAFEEIAQAFKRVFPSETPRITLKSDSLRLSVKLRAIQEVMPLITKGVHRLIFFTTRRDSAHLVKTIQEQITVEGVTNIKLIIYFSEYIIDYIERYLSEAINEMRKFINSITVVKDIDWKAIRSPQPLTKQNRLSPDASNFVPFLYTITEGNVSESLVEALRYAFVGADDLRLGFSVTEDGRVFLKLIADGVTLTPASIPSGVLKTLIIESLLSRAGVIVIDEFENSLHPELQQFLMDEFRSNGAFVILTTHSTVPLDYAKSVNEVVVLKLEGGETKVYRLGKEVEEALKKHKMTLSELFDSGLLEPIST